jgi:hypothetical protein
MICSVVWGLRPPPPQQPAPQQGHLLPAAPPPQAPVNREKDIGVPSVCGFVSMVCVCVCVCAREQLNDFYDDAKNMERAAGAASSTWSPSSGDMKV